MLRGVAEDGNDEDADKDVAQSQLVSSRLDGADQDLAELCDRDRRSRQHRDRPSERPELDVLAIIWHRGS